MIKKMSKMMKKNKRKKIPIKKMIRINQYIL